MDNENITSPTQEPPVSEEPKKKLAINYSIAAILLVVVVFFAILILILRPKSGNSPEKLNQNNRQTIQQPTGVVKQKQLRKTFPKPAFTAWKGGDIAPVNYVEQTQIFELKTNFNSTDAQQVAQKFSLPGLPTIVSGSAVIKAEPKTGDINRLMYDLKSGTYTYISSNGTKLIGVGANTASKVESFIKGLYPNDSTLAYFSSYKRKSTGANITYYLVYRDWNKTSTKKMPIFSPFGLLNLAEVNSLSGLNINSTLSLPTDADVYATSDRTDGYARADQFNAVTVGVQTKNGEEKIISVNSTIRPLKSTSAKLGKVLPYNQAINLLKENKSEIFFITPSDKKAASWDTIFPGNVAKAEVGEIQESYMAYLEYPTFMSQSQIKPYFIFKGKAKLSNGYATRFIAAVPAIQGAQTTGFLPHFDFFGDVFAQAVTPIISPTADPNNPNNDCQGGQCQGTFQVTPGPSPAVTELPAVTPGTSGPCTPDQADLMYMFVPNVGLWSYPGDEYWYYVPPADRVPIQQEVTEVIQSAMLINPNRKTPEQIFAEAQSTKCPIKAAFHTPSIFIYGQKGTAITLSPSFPIKAIPRLSAEGQWKAIIGDNGLIEINNLPNQYLYYEYSDISFTIPNRGWVIKKSQLPEFVKTVSNSLSLSTKEEERLAYELATSTEKISKDDLYIGLIPQGEIDKKLPLSLSPKPTNITRIHFYVSSIDAKPKSVINPILTPVQKSGTSLFEVGSYSAVQ